MILTQQIAEIQKFISKQGAFPFVIAWVQQWGPGNVHPCNSNTWITSFSPSLYGYICTPLFILACTTFNLVLVFPTHHTFIHDDENA